MKFCIITPTYNRGAIIERAINSILNQTYQEFELVIVDDGSTDNTIEVLRKYSEDARIKIIETNQNRGVNCARNTGLKNVSNDVSWITFLDSDDEFFLNALEKIKSVIETKSSEINYFRFPVKYTNGDSYNNTALYNTIGDYNTYLQNIHNYGDWVSVLSSHVVKEKDGFLFYDGVMAFESISWLLLSKKEKVYYDESIVLLCHTDNISISRPNERKLAYYENAIKGYTYIIEKFGNDLIENNKKVYVSYIYLLGYLNILTRHERLGLCLTFKAMKYDFFNIRWLRNFFSLTYSKYK